MIFPMIIAFSCRGDLNHQHFDAFRRCHGATTLTPAAGCFESAPVGEPETRGRCGKGCDRSEMCPPWGVKHGWEMPTKNGALVRWENHHRNVFKKM